MESSRLRRVQTKNATKQATVYVVLSVVILIAMIIWGIPAAAKFSGMFFTADNGNTVIQELRPTPPVFSDIPEATFSSRVALSGFAQPGVEVSLIVNGQEYNKILSDDAGIFEFNEVDLNEGDNTVYAYASTARGTDSEQSKSYTVTVDNTKPEITINSPSEGKVFRGQSERLAQFSGTVNENNTKVYVGDRMAIVQADGTFNLTYQLQEGDQEIKVRAIDQAQNEAEQIIKLRWEP